MEGWSSSIRRIASRRIDCVLIIGAGLKDLAANFWPQQRHKKRTQTKDLDA